jgi:Lon protease-like protein
VTFPERAVLPLFPLGTVLFPGLVLPLRVFEERYRALVRTLLQRPDRAQRTFGVVAIRYGSEVGSGVGSGFGRADPQLYGVGCTAEIRDVTEQRDGSFDLVTVGRRRYAIDSLVPATTPYAQASVTYLPEEVGPDADALAPRVLAAFRRYLSALRGDPASAEQLPEDPLVLSHVVAATAALSLGDRHALLAATDTATRLRDELRLLQRERQLLSQLRAVPTDLSDLPVRPGPN